MRELLLRRKLDELDRRVVERAEKLIDDTDDSLDIVNPKKGLEDSQIRNVLAVAEETQDVSVVENFIKYQIGRSNKGEKWRYGEDRGVGFGERMLEDIRELRRWAGRERTEDIPEFELAIRLVRRYLGYLARYFKYTQVRYELERKKEEAGDVREV